MLIESEHCDVQVFYFPNRQTEAHHKDGSKEIIFPNGTIRKILANGEEVPYDALSLSQEVLLPKPVHSVGHCNVQVTEHGQTDVAVM